MINLIDRYISKLFLTYFFSGLIVFLTLRITADATGLSVQYDVPISTLVNYYLYSLPQFIYEMIPVGCLVACIFTLGTMSRANELTALFSTGMSLARISTPILALVAIISALAFFAGDWLMPIFAQKKSYVEYVEIKKQPGRYSTVKTNKIWYRTGNVLFNIKTLNPETRVAELATFYYFDQNWELIQLINAEKAHIREGHNWELENGTVTVFVEESSFPLTKSFKLKSITIEEDMGDLQSTVSTSETLRVGELSKFIKKNKDAGLDTVRYEVDLQAKFSFALAGFVMCFLSIPFSVGKARSGSWARGVGICLGLAFFYWALYSSGLTMGRHGAIHPILAAWAPNVLMSLAALVLLLRLKR